MSILIKIYYRMDFSFKDRIIKMNQKELFINIPPHVHTLCMLNAHCSALHFLNAFSMTLLSWITVFHSIEILKSVHGRKYLHLLISTSISISISIPSNMKPVRYGRITVQRVCVYVVEKDWIEVFPQGILSQTISKNNHHLETNSNRHTQ